MRFEDIQVGESYAFNDQRKVTVLATDPGREMLQIRFHNGYETWAYAYQIACTWEQLKRERQQAKQARALIKDHQQSTQQQAEMTEQQAQDQGLELSIYAHSFGMRRRDDDPHGTVVMYGSLADLIRLLQEIDPDQLPDSARSANLNMDSQAFWAMLGAKKTHDPLDDLLGREGDL